ncbi:hypothetical protein [Nonomuraea sp. NPDC049480]|uniref:hypothetical protein n=1 Tax=Nonomuraea sp. NPDC049480 TaxID=3364353 RepID=UPI0037BC060D
MSENPDELPDAVAGVNGESDVVAERSGAGTPKSRRPIPADPPDQLDEPDRKEGAQRHEGAQTDEGAQEDRGAEQDEGVTRPDAGPTG